MRLEDRVTAGCAIYVPRIEFDSPSGRLALHLTVDPERPCILRVLRFSGVADYHREWSEPEDPDLLAPLIGINEKRVGSLIQIWIALDQSEISFTTEHEPVIDSSFHKSCPSCLAPRLP